MPQDDPYAAIAKPVSSGDPYAAIAKPVAAEQPSFSDILSTAWNRAKEAYRGDTKLTDEGAATLSGVGSVVRGTVGAVKGAAEMLKPPSWEEVEDAMKTSAGNPMSVPISILAKRMGKPVADVAKLAPEIPGAVRDINASPDPLGTYAKAAQETAGQGAGQAITAIAASKLPEVAETASNAPLGKVAGAPVRLAARAAETAINQKLLPVKKLVNLMTPADEAEALQVKVPGRDFGLSKTPDATGQNVPFAGETSPPLTKAANPTLDPDAALARIPRKFVYQATQEAGPQASTAQVLSKAQTLLRQAMNVPEQQPTVSIGKQDIVTPQSDFVARIKAQEAAKGQPQTEEMPEGMSPNEISLWQQGAFKEQAPEDVGTKVRAANPEPTRAEVKAAQKPEIPKGHTPAESSIVKSYKYDPKTLTLDVTTNNGGRYVHGDISPEQFKEFEAAKSKGKAWNKIQQDGILLQKQVGGKMVNVPRAVEQEDTISPEEWQAGHELETAVEGTPR